jgi:hypothetical protein
MSRDRRRSRWVSPLTHEIVKFFPSEPPRRHGIVLVDGERSRVLRAKVSWDGPQWTLHRLKVRPEP